MRRNDNPDTLHITPHRAWAYLYADPTAELSAKEHDHISECEQCLRLFILCLKSKTFGSVLKALGEDLDDRRSA
jgi:hypothetical protein